MSEQPSAPQTYRTPYATTEQQARLEKQPSHLERVQAATRTVLNDRHRHLEGSLEIDFQEETSRLQTIAQGLSALFFGKQEYRDTPSGTTLRRLIRMESQLGAELFGALPAYDRREFYCFDSRMWIWHEERMNPETGKHDVTTVSYNITDRGVLKTYGENESRYVQGDELEHFATATEEYANKVYNELYTRSQYIIDSKVEPPRNQDDYTLAA